MEQAKAKGFGTKPEEINVGEKIALIHAEVSEALQAYRHKNMQGKDGFAEEMGDAIQRILHLCAVLGVDVGGAILDKLEYNKDGLILIGRWLSRSCTTWPKPRPARLTLMSR